MARSYFAFYLCLIAVSWTLVHSQMGICGDPCVQEVFETYCGRASCVLADITERTEEDLCNPFCLDAISGAPLGNCLQTSPDWVDLAGMIRQTVMNNTEAFCAGIELSDEDLSFGLASALEAEEPSADGEEQFADGEEQFADGEEPAANAEEPSEAPPPAATNSSPASAPVSEPVANSPSTSMFDFDGVEDRMGQPLDLFN